MTGTLPHGMITCLGFAGFGGGSVGTGCLNVGTTLTALHHCSKFIPQHFSHQQYCSHGTLQEISERIETSNLSMSYTQYTMAFNH
jgi:hypothetical protein